MKSDCKPSLVSSCPRLLYLADVPVEASYHGSALIYRLLQGYPAERLCIMESNLHRSLPERRLAGVRYPSRAADAPAFGAPPKRLSETGRPLVFGFGGSINTSGHVRALCQLSEALERIGGGGRLNLYGPLGHAEAGRVGLLRANVQLCGLVIMCRVSEHFEALESVRNNG